MSPGRQKWSSSHSFLQVVVFNRATPRGQWTLACPYSPQLCVHSSLWLTVLLTTSSLLPNRHLAEHPHKQLPPQLIAFHRLFPSSLHSPTLETEHACFPDSPVSSYLPIWPRALGMLAGDFSLILHFSLLDTYFPSFSDNCIGSHCCNESLFHHTLLQLPPLDADGFSNSLNEGALSWWAVAEYIVLS